MTNALTFATIVQQRLDHINYFHEDGIYEGFYHNMAYDFCYSAHGAINYKRKQIADANVALDIANEAGNEREVEYQTILLTRMDIELALCEERFAIEKEVYFRLTKEQWKPRPAKAKRAIVNADAANRRRANIS